MAAKKVVKKAPKKAAKKAAAATKAAVEAAKRQGPALVTPKEVLEAAGSLRPLLMFATYRDRPVRRDAMTALARMTARESLLHRLIGMGALPTLLEALTSNDAVISRPSGECVANIAASSTAGAPSSSLAGRISSQETPVRFALETRRARSGREAGDGGRDERAVGGAYAHDDPGDWRWSADWREQSGGEHRGRKPRS